MDKEVHFESPSGDLARAKSFYESVFGRKMESVPERGYILIRTTAVAMKKIRKMGGEIVLGKIQVADMGYTAYRDTEGNDRILQMIG